MPLMVTLTNPPPLKTSAPSSPPIRTPMLKRPALRVTVKSLQEIAPAFRLPKHPLRFEGAD